MINFQHYNPTRIIFGKDVYKNIGEEVKKYGTRILMVYGGKSLKANGTYDEVVKSLKKAGVKFSELSGIKPNPRLTPVYEGIKIAREKNISLDEQMKILEEYKERRNDPCSWWRQCY